MTGFQLGGMAYFIIVVCLVRGKDDCITYGKCGLRCLQKLSIRDFLCKAVKVFEAEIVENFDIEYKDIFDEG